MALALYSKPDENCMLSNTSDDIDDYKPFTISFDGSTGGSLVKKLYVRNDNLDRYYTNIQIYPIDNSSGIDHTDGTTDDWHWKLMEKDIPPSEEDWDGVDMGNILTLSSNIGNSSLGDTATYLSFWVRVTIPDKQLADNIKDIYLRMVATETVVE